MLYCKQFDIQKVIASSHCSPIANISWVGLGNSVCSFCYLELALHKFFVNFVIHRLQFSSSEVSVLDEIFILTTFHYVKISL